MPTFANTINDNQILAKRSQCDYAGNDIQTTYATKTEVTTGLASKQDTISDLATIRSGAAAGATAVQPGSLATVATSGSYNDLSNKPTIPTVDQVYNASSTNAQSGTAVAGAISGINQVPPSTSSDADKVLKVNSSGTPEWSTGGGSQVQSDWTEADSSAPSYIENKPVPKTLTAGTGISITENASTITVASTVTAPVRDVTVDGTSVVSNGVAAITTPTVDQTYDASSTNAQSGVAVASGISSAVAALPTNLTSAQIQALKEALGVDETVLYSGLKSVGDNGSATYTLSELPTNFQKLKIYCCASDNAFPSSQNGNCGVAFVEWDTTIYTPVNTFIPVLMNGDSGSNFVHYWTSANVNGIRSTTWTVQGSLNSATSNAKWFHIYKIVGIHRIASN